MHFSRVLEPPVSGSAMETHILSLNLEVQAENFQLPAAVFAESLPRSFQPQEKPFVTSPVTLNPLSGTEKEVGGGSCSFYGGWSLFGVAGNFPSKYTSNCEHMVLQWEGF